MPSIPLNRPLANTKSSLSLSSEESLEDTSEEDGDDGDDGDREKLSSKEASWL